MAAIKAPAFFDQTEISIAESASKRPESTAGAAPVAASVVDSWGYTRRFPLHS
jgi:hypothetical protein